MKLCQIYVKMFSAKERQTFDRYFISCFMVMFEFYFDIKILLNQKKNNIEKFKLHLTFGQTRERTELDS